MKADGEEFKKRQQQALKEQIKEAYQKMVEDLLKTQQKDTHMVLQYTRDGELINEFKNAAEAMRQTGITTIRNALDGLQKLAGGYIWKYKNEEQK